MYKLKRDNDIVEVCTQVQASAFTSSGWKLVDDEEKKKSDVSTTDSEKPTDEDADSETVKDESVSEDKAELHEIKEPAKTGRKSASK